MTTERGPSLLEKVLRPLGAVAVLEAGVAVMPAPTHADVLNRPYAIVAQTPNFETPLATLPPSAINIEKNHQKILDLTGSIITDLNSLFPDVDTRVSALGYRISNAWVGQDNFRYIAFQRAIIQKGPDGQLYLWNTLDNMSTFGLDASLDNGSFGVTIPPKQEFQDKLTTLEGIFSERASVLNMPADVLEFAQATRKALEIGVPTGYENYGPYEVWRFQRLAIMKWNDGPQKGVIQGILTGDAAKNAGLIPAEVALATPDLGSGGNRETTAPERNFDLFYSSLSGKSEIRNFESGLVGFRPANEVSLSLIEDMLADFGLSGIKFLPTPGLKITNGTGLISIKFYSPSSPAEPRTTEPFVIYETNVDSGNNLLVKYNITNPNVRFDMEEVGRINISRALPTFIAQLKKIPVDGPIERRWSPTLSQNLIEVAGPML